jgi:predicted HAD superfamily phosphohydrolase YqeG
MLRLKKPELQPSQVCMVGDRLMTDVLFGNLNGMSTIWLTSHLEQGLFDVSRYVNIK